MLKRLDLTKPPLGWSWTRDEFGSFLTREPDAIPVDQPPRNPTDEEQIAGAHKQTAAEAQPNVDDALAQVVEYLRGIGSGPAELIADDIERGYWKDKS